MARQRNHPQTEWTGNRGPDKIKRRRRVDAFPSPAALVRSAELLLIEQRYEREVGPSHYFSQDTTLELKSRNNAVQGDDEAVLLPDPTAV